MSDYNNFITKHHDTTKKANCGGKCLKCNTKNIKYGIEEGDFVYYCITCGEVITKDQISVK